MTKLQIGYSEEGKKVTLDLSRLVEGRALIAGNSGAGKSVAMRTIIEQAAGNIQVIILDPEDEFITLREVMPDLLLVGPEGEVPAQIKTAALLAKKLVETGISAVVAINSLKPDERSLFVKLFLDSMMNLPKKYWHPLLLVVDEAHKFCPQKSKPPSKEAVIDLMSAGRKRGFTGILATQRLSKLDKDSFETNNVWLGRFWQPADQSAAADILGIGKSETLEMRKLQPGEFYAIGPALSSEGKMQMNEAVTKKPPSGKEYKPPAPASIKAVVAQLGDLPAEQQAQDDLLTRLQGENVDMARKLNTADKHIKDLEQRQPIKTETKEIRVEVPVMDQETINELRDISSKFDIYYGETAQRLMKVIDKARQPKQLPVITTSNPSFRTEKVTDATGGNYLVRKDIRANGTLPNPQQRILDAIAWFESIGISTPTQVAVAFLADYTYGGGAFNNPRGSLRSAGLVEYIGSTQIAMTDEGRKLANYPEQPLTKDDLQRHVMAVLPGPHQKILDVLLKAYPEPMSKDECAAASGYQPGGAFNNPLGRLRSMGLVSYPKPGFVVAESLLFLE